jgi:hypothetical protein
MSVAAGAFLIFAASQVGTPGPANMALMATGARFGFKAALPFVAGVALGKQLIIWPIGFGLIQRSSTFPRPTSSGSRGRLPTYASTPSRPRPKPLALRQA